MTVKKPKAAPKRKPAAKKEAVVEAEAPVKKVQAPSRSKKSPIGSTKNGASNDAFLVQEIQKLKEQMSILQHQIKSLTRSIPLTVFRSLQQVGGLMVDSMTATLIIKRVSEEEPESDKTHMLFVGPDSTFAVAYGPEDELKIVIDSSQPSQVSYKPFLDFIAEQGLQPGEEVKINIYDVMQ